MPLQKEPVFSTQAEVSGTQDEFINLHDEEPDCEEDAPLYHTGLDADENAEASTSAGSSIKKRGTGDGDIEGVFQCPHCNKRLKIFQAE